MSDNGTVMSIGRDSTPTKPIVIMTMDYVIGFHGTEYERQYSLGVSTEVFLL